MTYTNICEFKLHMANGRLDAGFYHIRNGLQTGVVKCLNHLSTCARQALFRTAKRWIDVVDLTFGQAAT